jgi:hypothetical protein
MRFSASAAGAVANIKKTNASATHPKRRISPAPPRQWDESMRKRPYFEEISSGAPTGFCSAVALLAFANAFNPVFSSKQIRAALRPHHHCD